MHFLFTPAELCANSSIVAMTSPLDHDAITTARQNLQKSFDIVATQGAYLVPRAGTPVWKEPYDEFATTLEQKLNLLILEQSWRRDMYHEAADGWPIGHTPPEVKQKYQAKVQARVELWGIASDDGSDNENNDNGVGARVSSDKAVAASYQADWLPTPSLSAESPRATQYKRKRWRISEEGNAETKCPARTRVNNDRKRQRTLDVGDEEDSKERPAKIRITTTGPSSRRLRTLRPRRPTG